MIHRVSNNTQTRSGGGLVNKLIDELGVEVHIPSYSFCGPGTKILERINQSGKNKLDQACKVHDIAYHNYHDLHRRHIADKVLQKAAWERVGSKDANISEKVAALGVAAAMKAKRSLGMGLRTRKTKKSGKAISFTKAVNIARKSLNSKKPKSALTAAKIAIKSLKPYRGKVKKPTRTIPAPTGGFIGIPAILGALGALGSLATGSAAVAKSINDVKVAQQQLKEQKRHNLSVEDKRDRIKNVILRKHKRGLGFYLRPFEPKNH